MMIDRHAGNLRYFIKTQVSGISLPEREYDMNKVFAELCYPGNAPMCI